MDFDEFRKFLTDNLIQRKTELKDLLLTIDHTIKINGLDETKKNILRDNGIIINNSNCLSQIRFWIVALYSHFEWYIKLVSDNYLELIYNNIDLLSLNDDLIRNKINFIANPNNFIKYKNDIIKCLKNKQEYEKIKSESNLKYEVFHKNILKIFWFNIQSFCNKFNYNFLNEYRLWKNSNFYDLIVKKNTFSFIFDNYFNVLFDNIPIDDNKNIEILKFILDYNLLKYRNDIAHWEMKLDIELTYEYLKDLEKIIYIFIDTFKDLILEDLIKYENIKNGSNNNYFNNQNVFIVPTKWSNEWNIQNKIYFCQKDRKFRKWAEYIWFYIKWKINYIWKNEKIEWNDIKSRDFLWDSEITKFIKEKYETLDFYDVSEIPKENINFDWIKHWRTPVQFQQYISLEELLN